MEVTPQTRLVGKSTWTGKYVRFLHRIGVLFGVQLGVDGEPSFKLCSLRFLLGFLGWTVAPTVIPMVNSGASTRLLVDTANTSIVRHVVNRGIQTTWFLQGRKQPNIEENVFNT